MPTYKNNSSLTYVIGSTSFRPLEEKEVNFYLKPEDYPGMKLINDEPIYSPLVYSENVSGEFDVLSNLTQDVCLIKIVTDSKAEVSFNGDTNKALVTQACPLELRPANKFKTIKVESGSANIELWKGFNWMD